jgi:cysteine desulfurase family protein
MQARITKKMKKNLPDKIIYLDQGATSRPKASGVGEAMRSYIEDVCVNVNRSTYAPATDAAIVALETRELLCRLFGFSDPTHTIFTPGQTWSLNILLKGYLRMGDHVLVGPLEHNAVMRPLVQLTDHGITFDRIPMRGDDELDLDAAEALVRPNTKLCVMTHASNISGTVMPVEKVGEFCKEHGIAFVIDAAQTGGHYPLDFAESHADAICVPGHKGLCGPSGIGAMLLNHDFTKKLEPLVTGGTGSDSHTEVQPSYMPDRFESGTPNLPGVYGLHAALTELLAVGVDARRAHEKMLLERFLTGLDRLSGFRVIGTRDLSRRVGVISCDFTKLDNADVADRLSTDYGVLTRCGLHCAPNAHKTYGTFPQGTVRFSFGYSNTIGEIDAALEALKEILS